MNHISPARKYFFAAVILIALFFAGYFAPGIIDQTFFQSTQVSVIGPIENQNLMNEAIQNVQKLTGKGYPMTVEEQAKGATSNQYVVSIDGTLDRLDGDELKQVGFIITVDKTTKSIFWSNVTEPPVPEQYYALFEEDLQGKMQLKSINKLRE